MVDEDLMQQRIQDLVHSKVDIPRPKTWSAYPIALHEIEFWLGDQDRFHHRIRYTLDRGLWRFQKLQP